MFRILISFAAAADELQDWLDAVVLLETGPSLCAGVLVDDQGTVATAYHCVASGRRPRVTTRGGAEDIGRLVATDPQNDLALVEAPGLAGHPWLDLRIEPIQQGDEVWALGHPYGSQAESGRGLSGTLQWSASRGVVSAVGRDLVQTDAALNPGNSGGPVVDTAGRIVGIASRKLRADNIGFAAPVRQLAELMEVREKSRPTGGQAALGVTGYVPSLTGFSGTLGLTGQLSLRDTGLFNAAVHLPVGYRWQALDDGTTAWVNAEFQLGARARVGRGRWSTTLDGTAGLVFVTSEVARIEDGQLVRLRVWPEPLPCATVRLGMGGSAMRWTWIQGGSENILLFGVDVDFPGVIAAF